MTVRRTIGGQGGGATVAVLGAEAETAAVVVSGASRMTSGEAETTAYPMALSPTLGTDGDTLTQAAGVMTVAQAIGTDGESLSKIIIFQPDPMGSDGDALALSGAIAVDTYAGTAARVDLSPAGGAATWTNPNNALARDGTEATISVSGSLTATNAISDELNLSGFSPEGNPSGWTIAAALLTVRHRWPFTFAIADLQATGTTLTFTLSALFSGGVTDVLKTIVCSTSARAASQATLVTETYDLTTRVITEGRALSEVRFDAVANLPITLTSGTTVGWNVDSAALTMNLTKASIT